MIRIERACLLLTALSLGCAAPSLETRRNTALPAITALRNGNFDDAESLAKTTADKDTGDPYSHIVSAIVRYKKSMHQLVLDGETLVIGGLEAGQINQRYLQSSFASAESELAEVEKDLAIVAEHKGISVELCLACWEIDWNGNGRVDGRDRRLFQIEKDANGEELSEDDPRRKPTFRFDDGDVAWARAFVAFERAGLDVLLAYDWTEAAKLAGRHRDMPDKITIRLVDPGRIAEAKKHILEGLAFSDAERRAYLAETDDDREWVPNPRQKSHAMPLVVDQALYDTWEGVIGDVRDLVEGNTGLAVADVLTLADEHMRRPPKGYLDIGSMLSHPKDIVVEIGDIDRINRTKDVEGVMKSIFGGYYVGSMKPSPLTPRLLRMKQEIDADDEELERKLRYLLWLN